MAPRDYALDPSWRVLLADLGVRPADVLRRAELPQDFIARDTVRLSPDAYHRLWDAIAAEVGDPLLPLTMGQVFRTESFSPPIFAAMCSPNLLVALRRLAEYKPLIAPIDLVIGEDDEAQEVSLTLRWVGDCGTPPASLVMTELVFFVGLARLATRQRVEAVRVRAPTPPAAAAAEAYAEFFGASVDVGTEPGLVFRRADARRPFLTANEGMWSMFEPQLRQRLAQLDASATAAQRVRAALVEGLPGGHSSMDSVAQSLAMSRRTLQRALRTEGTSYKQILRDTREALARHYLQRTGLPAAEISFLLGFGEPNSFYRAFNEWTGQTPDSVRRAAMA